jgi:hypothetical protein
MPKKKVNEKKNYLRYTYFEESWCVRDKDPEDSWDAGDTQKDWSLNSVYLVNDLDSFSKKHGYYSSDVPIDFEPKINQVVYCVVVRYKTGCTFGSVYGCGTVAAIYDSKERANKAVEEINNKTFESPQGYCEWVGYFERLEDCFVELKEIEE